MKKHKKEFYGLELKKKTEYGWADTGTLEDNTLSEYIDFPIHDYTINGFTDPDYDDKKEIIGTCRIIELRIVEDYDTLELADYWDSNFMGAIETLEDNTDLDIYKYNILYYVKELEISEKYRGNGYGKLLMRAIIRDLSCIYGIMVLQAYPFTREGSREEKNKYTDSHVDDLDRFYTDLGFTRLDDTEYMYLNTYNELYEEL